VPHTLQANCVKGRGEGRQIMGYQVDFDDQARAQEENTDQQEANSPVPKNTRQHDKRNQQDNSGEKEDPSYTLNNGEWQEADKGVHLRESRKLIVIIKVPHDLVPVDRLRAL